MRSILCWHFEAEKNEHSWREIVPTKSLLIRHLWITTGSRSSSQTICRFRCISISIEGLHGNIYNKTKCPISFIKHRKKNNHDICLIVKTFWYFDDMNTLHAVPVGLLIYILSSGETLECYFCFFLVLVCTVLKQGSLNGHWPQWPANYVYN